MSHQQLRSCGHWATANSHIQQTKTSGDQIWNPLVQGKWFIHFTTATPDTCQRVSISAYKYSKTCLKRPLKKKTKIGFQYQVSLNAGQGIAECSKGSILQYFRPSLSYHLSLRPLLYPLFSLEKKGYINFVSKSVCRPSVHASVRHVSCKCISA